MKKYFVYRLKKSLLPLACFTLFCMVIYVLPISATNYESWNNSTGQYFYYYYPSLHYANITIALGIMSVLIPIIMFSYKMNKRSVDMHYSLPISKTKILAVNFLVGLILMYVAYTIAYLWGFILIAMQVQRLYLIYYLYLYFASLIPAFITYAVTAFIFTRANTTIDGIISVASTLCILALATTTVVVLNPISRSRGTFEYFLSLADGIYFFPFTALSQVATKIGGAIISNNVSGWLTAEVGSSSYIADMCRLVSSILWMILAIAATLMLFVFEKKSKAENCGQITESWFCYKVQIPAYAVMLAALTGSVFALAFGMFVWSIIYKRSIKIGWKFAVALAVSIMGGVILLAVSSMIRNANSATEAIFLMRHISDFV